VLQKIFKKEKGEPISTVKQKSPINEDTVKMPYRRCRIKEVLPDGEINIVCIDVVFFYEWERIPDYLTLMEEANGSSN